MLGNIIFPQPAFAILLWVNNQNPRIDLAQDLIIQEVKIRCPFCLERQTILVEPDGGEFQSIIVDCQVCCHPLDVQLFWNEEKQKFKAIVEKSSGF